MAINSDVLNKNYGPFVKDYNWKDLILYALGVGASSSDLQYVYEKNLKVIPTFAVTIMSSDDGGMLNDLGVNFAGVLHYDQELIIHKPISSKGGKFVSNNKVTNIYDLGKDKGARVTTQLDTCDENGTLLFSNISTFVARYDGGFGGTEPQYTKKEFPDSKCDFEEEIVFPESQALLYRLSGDYNKLHADPEFAKKIGFEKPILHGLCTMGYACRIILNKLCANNPENLKRIKVRFKKPIFPGSRILLQIWKTDDGKGAFRMVDDKGDIYLDNGEVEWKVMSKPDGIRFDDQTVIITGAGSGLGRAYALEFAKRGANVVVNDFGKIACEDGTTKMAAMNVVDEITGIGGKAVPNFDSVSSEEGGTSIIKTALDAFGRVDILVNNAGFTRDSSLIKMTTKNWEDVLAVHLNGAFFVTRAAFSVMKEQGYGRIVMTTSPAGLFGNFGQANYSAAKMALIGFMNDLRIEGEKYGIKTNAIAPNAFTEMTKNVMLSMEEAASPDHIVPLVAYLASSSVEISGGIYQCGFGYYGRVAIVAGPSVMLGQGTTHATAEDIAANWDKVNSLTDAKYYPDSMSAVQALRSAH